MLKIKSVLRALLKGDNYLSPFSVIAMVCFAMVSCEKDKNKLGAEYQGPVETIRNMEVKYSEQGKLKVVMSTPLRLRYTNLNEIFPDTVNVDFYNPEGALITHLRSDSGRFDHNANVYIVMGNVRVDKEDENKVLTTTELKWSPATKKVFTEKPLVVRDFRTSEITNAVGMDADQDFSHIIFRKATGIYKFTGP